MVYLKVCCVRPVLSSFPDLKRKFCTGGIVAIYYFGTLLGCFLGGWAGDKYGRIKGIAIGSLWAILGAALQCSAKNVVWMIMARIINGVGTGVLNSVVPVWVNTYMHYTRQLR